MGKKIYNSSHSKLIFALCESSTFIHGLAVLKKPVIYFFLFYFNLFLLLLLCGGIEMQFKIKTRFKFMEVIG